MTVTPKPALVVETVADPSVAAAVAEVAAVTFPLACPPHSTPENIAVHIGQLLSAERFVEYIADPVKQVLVVRRGDGGPNDEVGPIIGYSLLVHEVPTINTVHAAVLSTSAGADAVANGAVTEISKMYVLPDHHSASDDRRPAHVLMAAAIDAAADRGSTYVWLGVHSGNERAKKYYTKMGFAQIGTKSFNMNGAIEHDFVLGRPVRR